MSNQEGRRKAWAELAGIPETGTYDDVFMEFAFGNGWLGTFNDRMVQYLQSITATNYTNLPDLERKTADLLGVTDWNMVGYDIITLSGPMEQYFFFDGATQRAPIAAWTPSTDQYRVSANFLISDPLPTVLKFVVCGSNNNTGISTNTSPNIIGKFIDDVAANITMSDGAAAIETLYEAVLSVAPLNSSLDVNGSLVTNMVANPAIPTYTNIGGTSGTNTFHGTIYGVHLEDLAVPANNRYYPMNEGAGDTFFCYTDPTLTTPVPAGDATIFGYTDNWGPLP